MAYNDLEQLKQILNPIEKKVLDLYLQRKTQKFICNEIGCTRGYIDTIVHKYKLTRFRDRKLYYCNDALLSLKNPKIWYFLGFFASDGNMYITNNIERVQFAVKDKDALDSIVKILEYSGNVTSVIKNNKQYWQLIISYPPLNSLIKSVFGEAHRKTKTLKFPSIHNRTHLKLFLRGFIDGDGCFSKTRKKYNYNFTIYCESIRFIRSLYKVLLYITQSHVCLYKEHYISLGNHKANTNLYKFLYSDFLDIGIHRKQERALQHIKLYNN